MSRPILRDESEQFALALPLDPTHVALWCDGWTRKKDGSVRFRVINGAWQGVFNDKDVLVEQTGNRVPAVLVWQGKVPQTHARDYNEAIMWIEEQIREKTA